MKTLKIYGIAAVVFLAISTTAIGDQKGDLIDQILASKERPGRELDPAFRAILRARLHDDSVEILQKKLETGVIRPAALGDSSADMTYTTFQQPCRILDTRIGGGALVNGVPRNFYVTGTTGFADQGGVAGGCNVPAGSATAVMINFVAVAASGAGNLRGSAFPNPIPAAGSIINYAALTPQLNIANGIVMPVCDATAADCAPADMTIQANGGSTQLVADVLGYFTSFPKDEIRSFSVSSRISTATTIGSGCTNYSSLIVNAPVAGKILVRANVTVSVPHANGAIDSSIVSVNSAANQCQDDTSFGESQLIHVDAALPTGTHMPTANAMRMFSVPAGPFTIYLNGYRTAGAAGQAFSSAGIEATFFPD